MFLVYEKQPTQVQDINECGTVNKTIWNVLNTAVTKNNDC